MIVLMLCKSSYARLTLEVLHRPGKAKSREQCHGCSTSIQEAMPNKRALEIVDARLSLGLVSLEDKDVRRVPQSAGF